MPGAAHGEDGLTEMQRRFLEEYLVNPNATQAATAAGYTPSSARVQGHQLLKHPVIAARLAEERRKRAQAYDLKAQDVIDGLMHVAFHDPASMFDDEGRLLPVQDMPEEARRALAGIEVDSLFDTDGDGKKYLAGVTSKIKFNDRVRALEMLAKHFGLVREKVEVSGDTSFADMLKAARERSDRR